MRILKEGSIYFGASVLEKAVPFLLIPFLTRLLSTEEYGVISIFVTLTAIYGLAIGFGLGGFVRVIFHKSHSHEFNKYVGNVLVLTIASLLVALLVTVLFQKFIVQASGLESDLIPLIIVVASAQFLLNLRLIIYQTTRRAWPYGKLQVFRPILDMLLVLVLVGYLNGGGVERIYALVLSNVIAGAIACLSLYRGGLLNLNFDKIYSLRALRFALPLLPHSVAITAVVTVDKLILSSNIGLAIVGELAVALALASPTLIITESINRSFMPWSFEKFRKGELDHVVGASYILLLLMIFVCLVYSVFLAMFYDLIVGKTFQNALGPAMILIWVGWLKLAYYLVAKGLVYCEDTRFLPIVSVTAGIIYIGTIVRNIEDLTLVDISLYMIIFHVVMFVGVSMLSQLRYPQPWEKLSSAVAVGRLLITHFRLG